MTPSATIKAGDTARLWTDTLTLDDAPIDLTGATVALRIKRLTDGTLLHRDAEIVLPATAGTVSYQPVADDVAQAGSYRLEWVITFGDATQLTVPSQGAVKLQIEAALP